MRLEEKKDFLKCTTHTKSVKKFGRPPGGALLTGAVTFFSHNIEKKREIIIIYFLERA